MKDEYTAGNYPCYGKTYSGEKAAIGLTSWRARIDTVSKTLYSLVKQCPGFHIVLTLSEDEFPDRERELPKTLLMFCNAGLLEILWVRGNYRSYKKWLFASDKYRNIPVVSADDCIYMVPYAEKLYESWETAKTSIHTINGISIRGINFQHGPATIYPPHCFGGAGIMNMMNPKILETNHDDVFYGCLASKMNIPIANVGHGKIYVFHDCTAALSSGVTWNEYKCIDICNREIKV